MFFDVKVDLLKKLSLEHRKLAFDIGQNQFMTDILQRETITVPN